MCEMSMRVMHPERGWEHAPDIYVDLSALKAVTHQVRRCARCGSLLDLDAHPLRRYCSKRCAHSAQRLRDIERRRLAPPPTPERMQEIRAEMDSAIAAIARHGPGSSGDESEAGAESPRSTPRDHSREAGTSMSDQETEHDETVKDAEIIDFPADLSKGPPVIRAVLQDGTVHEFAGDPGCIVGGGHFVMGQSDFGCVIIPMSSIAWIESEWAGER